MDWIRRSMRWTYRLAYLLLLRKMTRTIRCFSMLNLLTPYISYIFFYSSAVWNSSTVWFYAVINILLLCKCVFWTGKNNRDNYLNQLSLIFTSHFSRASLFSRMRYLNPHFLRHTLRKKFPGPVQSVVKYRFSELATAQLPSSEKKRLFNKYIYIF